MESLPAREEDPRLQPILEQYGEVVVFNHKTNQLQPLFQAVNECPPLVTVLLNAESPEELQEVIDSQRAPQ